LTKNLEREIKNVLTKDEYCAYDNFLGIVYHKVKDDKRNGSTLNEHAFKDFMMFYCFLMYRILSFSVDVNLSKLKVIIRSKSRTKTLKGGGPIKSLKGLIYFTFIYFLLSGFGFYESIRNVRDAKRIPENMRGHKEFFDLESEISGKDAIESINLFMQKTLSTLVNKNYIESLYDATYASGEVCIPDFNLIFSQDNLNVLVDEIKVLSIHGAEVKALYPKKFKRPEIPFYDVPKNIVNRARTAKKKFDSRNDSDVDVWVEDGFGFVTQYDGSCMSGEILKREAVARTKKGRDMEAYHRKLENWMDRIRRASSSLRMRFYNMMATAGVISFFIYVLIQTQNEQEKRQREGNALNLDENDIHKLKNVSNRTLSKGYNYLSNKWSKTKRIASKVGHAFKEDMMELTRPRHGPIVSVKDTKEYIPTVTNAPITGISQTHIRRNRYGTRIVYERGDQPEIPISDIVSGTLCRDLKYRGREEQPPYYMKFKYLGGEFKMNDINTILYFTNKGLLYKEEDSTYLFTGGSFKLFNQSYQILESMSLVDFFSKCSTMNKFIYVGEDKLNPGRLLFKVHGYSGDYHNFIGQKGPLYHLNPQKSGLSLSRDGMVSTTQHGLRYEEDNIRYRFDRGYLMVFNPYLQAEPTRPDKYSKDTNKWMEESRVWNEAHKNLPEENPQMNGFDLLREDYHLADPFLKPLQKNHVPGYMDAYKMESQADYIEKMEKQGWVYNRKERILERSSFTNLRLKEDPFQRHYEQWKKEDDLQSRYVAQKAAEDRAYLDRYGFKGHATMEDWHNSVLQNSVKRTMDRI